MKLVPQYFIEERLFSSLAVEEQSHLFLFKRSCQCSPDPARLPSLFLQPFKNFQFRFIHVHHMALSEICSHSIGNCFQVFLSAADYKLTDILLGEWNSFIRKMLCNPVERKAENVLLICKMCREFRRSRRILNHPLRLLFLRHFMNDRLLFAFFSDEGIGKTMADDFFRIVFRFLVMGNADYLRRNLFHLVIIHFSGFRVKIGSLLYGKLLQMIFTRLLLFCLFCFRLLLRLGNLIRRVICNKLSFIKKRQLFNRNQRAVGQIHLIHCIKHLISSE